HFAADRQPAIGIGAESVWRHEVAGDHEAVRRADTDSRQRGRARALDAFQRPHRGEHARRLWTQVLGAWLRPWKPRTIDEQHVYAAPCESDRDRRPARTAPDDEDVRFHLEFVKIAMKTAVAAAPPMIPLKRFTKSLSSPAMPPVTRVDAPQSWRTRSVATPHASHHRRVCAFAPITESASAPTIPPTTAARAVSRDHPMAVETAATNMAPASAPRLPITVTPPDVPTGTARPDRIERGTPPNRVPISVAQVSAAEAASAPAPSAIHQAPGW